jgi:pyruvate dehydrogenase E2 component (dihydrolipoamide acetyltransferase)
VLLYVGTGTGGKLQVDDLLAILGTEGEDISGLLGKPTAAAAPAAIETPAEVIAPPPASRIDVSALEEVVLMPRLSDTMTEGVLASWQKNVGDTVKKGEVLAEIETDKATMELESYKNGKLLYQGAKVGEKIQVNDLLCIIGDDGFDVAGTVAALKNPGTAVAAAPVVETKEETKPAATTAPAPTVAQPSVVNEGRIFASPLAKKVAAEKGIDLKYVHGSGDNGRIVKEDVDNFKPTAAPSSTPAAVAEITTAAPAAKAPAVVYGTESYEEFPVSQMRKVIARRLSESLFTAPHFYLTISVDMDAAIAARTKINETAKSSIESDSSSVETTSKS